MMSDQPMQDAFGDHAQLVDAGRTAVEAASKQGVLLRCLGGVAVALRCPSASAGGPLARGFSDLDFATTFKQVKGSTAVLSELGYRPNERFNAAHGESRLLFEQADGRHVDVFVDRFELCHVLPLRGRLGDDELTAPLAELLLTKLQVAKLAHKDVTDAAALLLDHPLTSDDSGVNAERIVGLLASDWGWWRTATETVERLGEHLERLPLEPAQTAVVQARLDELRERIAAAPKSLRWRARARIGERRPWREDPDEMEA